MRKTVLIFGASSFVGSNLAMMLKDDYRVIGTYYKTPIEIPGVTCYPCDILKKDYVSNLIRLIKPDFTLYAIGLSSLTESKLNPKIAEALNTTGAINACTPSERYGSKFIYFSSSYALGGEPQIYKEADTPFPNTAYGSSLSSTEFWIQRSCLNYLVLRCCPLYGRSYGPRHPNWFEIIQTAFAQNKVLPADDNVLTGYLDVFILGKLVKLLLESNAINRLFQISSRNFMTHYEFANLVGNAFEKDVNLIQRTKIPFPVEHGGNKMGEKSTSEKYQFMMDTSNIESFLNLTMPSIEESVQITKNRIS